MEVSEVPTGGSVTLFMSTLGEAEDPLGKVWPCVLYDSGVLPLLARALESRPLAPSNGHETGAAGRINQCVVPGSVLFT